MNTTTDETRRRCTTCARRLLLTAANFAVNTKAKKPSTRFAYTCKSCKSVENAVLRLRREVDRVEALQGFVRPLADVERDAIEDAIRLTAGDLPKAAKLLGIGKATIYRKTAAYAKLPPRPEGRGPHALAPDLARLRFGLARIETEWSEVKAGAEVLDEAERNHRARELLRAMQDFRESIPTGRAPRKGAVLATAQKR